MNENFNIKFFRYQWLQSKVFLTSVFLYTDVKNKNKFSINKEKVVSSGQKSS